MSLEWIDSLGVIAINRVTRLGKLGVFMIDAIKTLFQTRFKTKKFFEQALHIGVNSWSVVFLTGASVGSVLAYQSYIGLHRFGGESYIGPVVFLAMTREFGPVLSALMVAARAGSAMTAEIGTMRITEQIDALKTLCIDTNQYLIVPRIVATTIMMPFLALFCAMVGVYAGYLVSIHVLNVNPEMYMKSIKENVELFDITSGMIKATVFGFLLSWIATYKGFTTHGGAKGVGLSTTQSVVMASVTIFISDYILTAWMFN